MIILHEIWDHMIVIRNIFTRHGPRILHLQHIISHFTLSPKQLSCLMMCWTITGNIEWSRVTRLSIIFGLKVMFLVSIPEPSGLWIYYKGSRFEHRLCSSAWKGPPLLLTSTRGVFVVWIVVVMIRLPHSHAHNSWFSFTASFLGIWFLEGIIGGPTSWTSYVCPPQVRITASFYFSTSNSSSS